MPQTKGGLSAAYLPETSQEAMQANEQYQQALSRLTSALDARKNRIIDPVMMSMAAGFLTPGQTGSFGEALGRVAGELPKAIQTEEQEQAQIAKSGLDVASQNIALQRMREGDRMKRNMMLGLGIGPSGTPMAGQQPKGGLPQPAGAQARPGGISPKIAQALAMMAADPNVSAAELAKMRIELERGAFKPTEGGSYDADTGVFTPRPGMAPVKRQLYNFPELGVVEISPALAARHDEAVASGDPMEVLKVETEISEGPSRPAPRTQGRIEPTDEEAISVNVTGRRPRLRSAADIEAEAARTKKQAEIEGQTEGERKANILTKGDAAGPTIQLAENLTTLASAPDAKEIFGLARQSENGVAMLASLLGSGIGLPGGMSVGIPELPEIYRALALTEDQQRRYQFFLQQAREMAIKMSEFAKGSVSNYEQTLFSQASVNENDLASTIIMKSNAMKARAEFDKARADLLDSGQFRTMGELKKSPQYQRLKRDLDRKYQRILQDNGMLPKSAQTPSGVSLSADQIRAESEARGR